MKLCYINPTFLIRRPIMELIDRLDFEEIGLLVPKKIFKKVDMSWHSSNSLKKAKIYSYSCINIPFSNFEWPIPITLMFFINLFRIFLKYDIIHMWTYFYINNFFTIFFKLFFNKKLIMTCDTFPAYSFRSGKFIDFLFRIYTTLFGWILFSVPNKIHIYGKSLVKFAKRIGIKEKKLIVIPTGVNLDKFKRGKDIRKNLGIDKKEFVIVYAGLIVPRKGIDIMLKILKKSIHINVRMLLVGEGPNKKYYIELAKRFGVIDKISFIGWRKDIPDIFRSADLLFLPSRGEGLPGVIMEAMASELPVVASNIPCIPDLVENGKNGFLCKMNDVECFKEKILKLVHNKRLAKKMGKNGLEKIKSFDWDKIIQNYIELYK